MRLTKRTVDAAIYHGRGGAHYEWDDELTGFGLRIYPKGRKSFVAAYRTKGRQRFHTVGRFGELTVQEARDMAREVLVGARRGEDPSGARIAYRRGPNMRDLATRYMEEHARPYKKPTSIVGDELNWRKHILPDLGNRKVSDIGRDDISRLILSKAATPYAANRVLALLSKSFNLAEVWGWRPNGSNPCRHVKPFREERRERFLSQVELGRLADVLAEAETAQTQPPEIIAALRLLLFTGCRMGEILTLRWCDVDFERRCLRLPDSKTGKRAVYLSAPALEVLAGLGHEDDNPHVLPGRRPGSHLVNIQDAWQRLRAQAGLRDVRIHDLRHSYASVGAGIGLSLPMLGKLLGHTQAATTERYAHLSADPLHHAADLIGASLEAAMNRRPKAPVVPFDRRQQSY